MSRTLSLICLVFVTLIAVPAHAQAPVQTAELTKRGLGPADFPRVIKLADNVYAYEEVHVGGEITTNNLIVVTREGVLVVDGQGTPEKTARLVAETAAATTRPQDVAASPDDDDDAIYQKMLSEWLVDPHELSQSSDLNWKSVWDNGWSAAEAAEATPVRDHTVDGLPVRLAGGLGRR